MLEQAIQKFDLTSYVLDYGADQVQEHEWIITCPRCFKEKLTINVEKRTWHCWICQQYVNVITPQGMKKQPVSGAGGLIDLLQLLEEIDREAAIAKVMAGNLLSAEELSYIPEVKTTDPTEQGVPEPSAIPFPDYAVPLDWQNLPFLQQRQITQDDERTFGLFWCYDGRYRNRLIFPVWEQGTFVYFQGRAMWGPQPGRRYVKSLNPGREHSGAVSTEVLMNLDTAKNYPRVAIVEGPTDLVRTGPDAVCTFGKQISAIQIAKLLEAGVKALDFMWDSDAQDEMVGAALRLAPLFDVRVVFLPNGDPGDFPRDHLQWYRSHAHPVSTLGVGL